MKIEDLINKEGDSLIAETKVVKPFETWRIKVDGVFIRTQSKKTVWKKINHAKAALRLHFEGIKYKWRRLLDSKYSCQEADGEYEKAYQKFLKERVEFVRID